jgi:hypothetical protein
MAADEVELGAANQKALAEAVDALERPGLASRLADYAGQPVNKALRMMPAVARDRLNGVVRSSILKCLDWAIDSLDKAPRRPDVGLATAMAGFTGAVGGAFGWAALPIELPITTTLMLRAIATIARHQGEDLQRIEGRLACMEVFALGGNRAQNKMNVGYYAAREFLARLTGEASAYLVERGIASASTPAVTSFVGEISARYGLVVSDRVAASAVPVVGAIGGATINVIFMDHFQRIAIGHFTVRRLERRYGRDAIQRRYVHLARRAPGALA